MSVVDKLLRGHLRTLQVYQSARRLFSGGQDWLNANESPFEHRYALGDIPLNRYPSCQPKLLIEAYADYAGVRPDQTLTCRGADEAIELLVRTFGRPGHEDVLICPPTYGMYAISAKTHGVGVVEVPTQDDFQLDVNAMTSHDVRLVFVCAPNNPTGTVPEREAVRALLEHFADKALVVVDQAYVEFSPDESWASELDEYKNLVVLRTLSKAFALAGIRCGFALASPEVVAAMMKVIAPYPVPAPVADIAQQALSARGQSQVKKDVRFLTEERDRLEQRLQALGFEIVGGNAANFVLFRYPRSTELMKHLVAQGILIRDQSKQTHLQNCLRATVGFGDQNDTLIDEIKSFLEAS